VHVGARAEEVARRFAEAQGLEVVTCNYRCRFGELDLILLDGATVVVAEVRYRALPDPVPPAATITHAKRRRLALAAAHYLQREPRFRERPVRFDVLALSGTLDAVRCEWIRGAFTLDDVGRLRL
jgi:putative endonuclease